MSQAIKCSSLNTILYKFTTNRVATDAFPGYQDQDATTSPCRIVTRL